MAKSSLAQALGGEPQEKPKSDAAAGSYSWMLEQARTLKIPGRSGMNKEALAGKISEALADHGSKRTRAPRAQASGPSSVVPPAAAGAAGPGLLGLAGPQEMAPPEMPPEAEAAPGLPPQIEARLQRMLSLNAPPEAIAQFLNQSVR